MADDDGEKTEDATDAKREEFRKKGQVASTKELASAVFLLVLAMGVYAMSKFFFGQIVELFHFLYGDDLVAIVRTGELKEAIQFAGLKLFYMIAPVLGISAVLGIGSSVIQTGFLQVEDALTPNLDKINPLNGFGRIFSLRTVMEGVKSVLKISFVGLIVFYIIKSELFQFPQVIHYSIEQIIQYMGHITFRLLVTVGFVMLGLALADYFFQRWDLEKQMMMSKQEVKEEHKSREGDPMIKSRIRRIQREMASKRMMQEVPKGDVVITNPTHIAIVLKYSDNLPAPQLIAKGADNVAEKIKALAREHNIPIVENKPLARTIFKTLKIGQVIPRELFVAVAEVLAYVFKLRRRGRR